MSFFKNLLGIKRKGPVLQGHSIQGRKSAQEDAYLLCEPSRHGTLVLVADGVGGHGHGDFASNLCVEVFQEKFEKLDELEDVEEFLRVTAMTVATRVLEQGKREPAFRKSGTTLTGFLVQEDIFTVINIGDSRVYELLDSGEFLQLTHDHSVVQELMEAGEITKEEMRTHPQRNIMTSAIGQELTEIKIQVEGPYPIDRGELLLACSDGVHDAISDEQIRNLLVENKDSDQLAERLVEAAYENGGKDNITACIYIH